MAVDAATYHRAIWRITAACFVFVFGTLIPVTIYNWDLEGLQYIGLMVFVGLISFGSTINHLNQLDIMSRRWWIGSNAFMVVFTCQYLFN